MVKLTLKQQRFADEYIITGNATQSAITAGYSERTAQQIATENLTKPLIKQYIEKRLAELDETKIMEQREVMTRLTQNARREERDYQVVIVKKALLDADGNYVATEEVPQVVEVPTQNKDAIKALELIGKRYGMWTDKQEITGNVAVQIVDDVPSDSYG